MSKTNFDLLDVHDIESEPSSSEDEAVADASLSAPNTPLSKKARARRRAAERKALRKAGVPAMPSLEPKGPLAEFSDASVSLAREAVQQDGHPQQQDLEVQGDSQPVPQQEVVQEEETVTTAYEGDDEPRVSTASTAVSVGPAQSIPAAAESLTVEAAPTPAGTNTPLVGESSVPTSDTEDEGLEQASAQQSQSESAAQEQQKQEQPQAPQSKDHQPGSKWRSIITRTIWTIIMVAGFVTLTLMGHAYVVLIIFLIQLQVFRELAHLFEAGAGKSSAKGDHHSSHSPAYLAAKERKRVELVRYSRIITWYFFAVFNYFLYGEVIIYYFKHIVLVDAYFVPFVKHHRFISFCLYTLGFVSFVGTLRRDALRTQFGLFAWVHISLFLVILSSHFMVNNIFEGLIWFWVPVSLVICNDIWAYICGMLFGRTQLIQLSPKKTVEGFVGALWCTVIFGYFWGTLFMRFPYFICPCRNLGMNFFSNVQCEVNPVFLWHHLPLPDWLASSISSLTGYAVTDIPWAPFQLHSVVMAVFASLVAPFGGFFASGFKRAFNIKDFGDSIPGHGGLTDRFDCQFLMGIFSYVYYSSLVRTDAVSVATLLETAVTALSREDQLLLLEQLSDALAKTTPS